MRAWEMIKELMESPEKKFYRPKYFMGKSEYVTVINNRIVWQGDLITCKYDNFPLFITLDDNEWEELKQPVTWQEALEAWGNGKDVTLVTDGKEYFIEFNDLALERKDIKEGEWFINE